MATITTDTYLDGGTARTAGEAWTCNGAKFTIRTDTRWHANAPASMTGTIGATTISATLGGGVLYDGRNVRWMPYDTGTGNVPAIGTTVTQGGVSGYLLGVWDTLTSAPTAVGAAMPADGFIKFREVTGGPFTAGALTGIGASATGPDVTGWIEVVQDNSVTNTVSRAGTGHQIRGDWFYLDNTNGTRGQVIQVPTNGGGTGTTAPGLWIETGVGTDAYEYWPALSTQTAGNGWAYNHIGAPTGLNDRRHRFVKGLGSGQLQIGESITPLAATYASVSQASTYTWARGLLTVTFTAHGLSVGQQVYLDFTTGGGTPDGVYTVAQVTGANTYIINLAGSGTSGNVTAVSGTTVTFTAHGLAVGNVVQANVSTGTLASGAYEVLAVVDANNFRIATPTAPGATGNVSIAMDIGEVPASGRKIRIPNVFVRHATTAARASNDRTSIAVRPTFTVTGAGAIDHEYAYGDVLYSVTQPYSFKLHHCATMDQMNIAECATAIDMLDGGVSMDLAGDVITLNLTSNFAGGTISGWKFHRGNAPGTGDHAVSITTCAGQTFTNCEAGIVQFPRNSGAAWNVSQSKDITFTNCTGINGGAFSLTTCTDIAITDYNHVDRFMGYTNATSATYVFQTLSKCNNVVINGVTEGWSDTIPRVHAYAGVLTSTASDNIKMRNVGTLAVPLGSSAVKINDRGVIYASGGNNSSISLQRCYVTTVRTNSISDLNSDKNVLYEQVRAKSLNTYMPFTLAPAALNSIVTGCQAPILTTAANASVYGSHMQDSVTTWFRQLGTYTWASNLITVSFTAHGLQVGDTVRFNANSGTAPSDWYGVNTVPNANSFTIYLAGSGTAGDCTFYRDLIAGGTEEDTIFTSEARLHIPMNEPTTETSAYVTVTGNAQFTSVPSLILPSSGDEVVIESQRRIIGYLGHIIPMPVTITGAPASQAASYTWAANVVTVTFTAHGYKAGDTVFLDATSGTLPDGTYVIAGITSANVFTISLTGSGTSGNATIYRIFRLRYQVDGGSGYGSWHNLDYPKAGVSTTATSTTMTMQSTAGLEVGDWIFGNSIPYQTYVASIDSGTQITMSNAAWATQTNQIMRFSYLGQESYFAGDPTGFLFKVSIKAETPGSTMALTYVSIPIHTNTTQLELQYPLDTNTITLTGLKNPTEIRIFDAGTATEITGQENVTSGTYVGTIDAGTYPSVDISIISLGYQNTRLLAVDMSGGNVSIPVQQVIDRQYGNL